MNTSLKHLPETKQNQIQEITTIIKAVVDPEMIILFGSYAKGTYVEHQYTSKDGITYEYISDYDFLVVTKDNPEKSYDQESLIMNKTERYKQPVNLEVHEIAYINKGLVMGEYFFVDIVKEGILLYDKGSVKFAEPRKLSQEEKREKAQRYFDTWFPQATEFILGSKFYIERKNVKLGVFQLHQATENLYYATLLTFTDYKPKTHNLWKLRKKCKPYSEELFLVFHMEADKQEEHLFDLLKQGYVDARYRGDYSIEEQELAVLIERISIMVAIVEKICKQKIASFVG